MNQTPDIPVDGSNIGAPLFVLAFAALAKYNHLLSESMHVSRKRKSFYRCTLIQVPERKSGAWCLAALDFEFDESSRVE